MKRRSTGRSSVKKSSSSGTIIYLIFFFLLVLASITWIQSNTRPRNFAEDTPLLRCESPCTYNSQCPTGLFCFNGTCRNPQCKDASDCTCVITPTYNPSAPTSTPRLTSTPKPTVVTTATLTPTYKVVPTATPVISPKTTAGPTPGTGLIYITPQPGSPSATPDPTKISPTETPVFEVDKNPQKKSFGEAILNFLADIFCRIFGC